VQPLTLICLRTGFAGSSHLAVSGACPAGNATPPSPNTSPKYSRSVSSRCWNTRDNSSCPLAFLSRVNLCEESSRKTTVAGKCLRVGGEVASPSPRTLYTPVWMLEVEMPLRFILSMMLSIFFSPCCLSKLLQHDDS